MASLRSLLVAFCVLSLLASLAAADMYLQAFPGSNNRLDEANRERNNGNRLFDSQNNNRGGYNVQSYHFVAGSIVQLQWTNQHGCGVGNGVDCQVILQMMCDPRLRDGTTTNTIPNEEEEDTNPKFGRHESYYWYRQCTQRERNKGLFTADQNLNGNSARFTRQNPNGNRHGYECPEERDYYPYWLPTPWMDIAILTDRPELCPWLLAQSQNVLAKFHCVINTTTTGNTIPVSEDGCLALNGNWTEVAPWGLPEPVCKQAPWTRENHLGNEAGSENQVIYNWTVPDLPALGIYSQRCALRIRYNISSNDYNGWDSAINASLNDEDGLKLNLAGRFNSPNPYPFTDDPDVNIGNGLELELAINTAQIGRTFQDRSHRFAILPSLDASELPNPDTVIHNLNVMGKRGNIVQTFPAQEYFYVPEVLYAKTGDLVHIQWSGSNTNPDNNAGEGQEGSDRHNMMETDDNDLGRVLPAHISNATLFNITAPYRTIVNLFSQKADGHLAALTDPAQHGGSMSLLNDAGTYFDGGLFVLTKTGSKNYMNSRNNNFSNRQQKAKIVVTQGPTTHETGFIVGMAFVGVITALLLAAAGVALYQHMHKPSATPAPV